jgi:hypothetical protein
MPDLLNVSVFTVKPSVMGAGREERCKPRIWPLHHDFEKKKSKFETREIYQMKTYLTTFF